MDQETKMILQKIKVPVGDIEEEGMIFYFKSKEFHMTFGEIRL